MRPVEAGPMDARQGQVSDRRESHELALPQAITDATDGFHLVRGIRAELLSEQMDICLNGVGRECHAVRPGVVEQLVARQNLAGPAEQALEDGELALTEIHRLAGHRDAARGLVELYPAGLERAGLARGR